jgi:hypothetical protein
MGVKTNSAGRDRAGMRPMSPEGWPLSCANGSHDVRIPPRDADWSKLSEAERDLWLIEYRLPQYQAVADSAAQCRLGEGAGITALLAAHRGAERPLAEAPSTICRRIVNV